MAFPPWQGTNIPRSSESHPKSFIALVVFTFIFQDAIKVALIPLPVVNREPTQWSDREESKKRGAPIVSVAQSDDALTRPLGIGSEVNPDPSVRREGERGGEREREREKERKTLETCLKRNTHWPDGHDHATTGLQEGRQASRHVAS